MHPLLLLLMLSPVAQSETVPVPSYAVTQITHVRVIDGTGRPAVENATLTIEAGKIKSIVAEGKARQPSSSVHVIDGTGKTIIPGLINAHGHLALVNDTRNDADYYTREHVLDELRQYEQYGVTTMLSLGLNRDLIYGIRAEQRAGKLDGASVLVADRGIGVPNGVPPIPHQPDQLYTPATAAEARTDVDEAAGRRTDFIKIWLDDMYGTRPKMTSDIFDAVLAEAHAHHVPVAAHVWALDDAKQLVERRVDVLAHSVRDQPLDAALMQAMKQHGTFYIPTLTVDESFLVYQSHPAWMDTPFFQGAISPELFRMLTSDMYLRKQQNDPTTARHRADFAMAQRNLRLALDAGIKVGFGTDSGASPYRIPGFAEHHELAMMVAAGLTPMEAIHAATGTNAQLLGIAAQTGTLVPGHRADLILLGGNPLDGIENTEKIVTIWHGGREIQPKVPFGKASL